MFKTFLVWYLVSIGGYNGDQVVWSPPMATQADCERAQAMAQETRPIRSRCIQLTTIQP